jgi:hypothetical protein
VGDCLLTEDSNLEARLEVSRSRLKHRRGAATEQSRLLVFTEVSSWPGQAAGQMLGGVARDAGCPPFGVAR